MSCSIPYIENNLIPTLEKEKQKLKKLIKSEQSIEEKLELQDKLKEIKKRISKEKKKKKEYLLQNAKHVFDYFEKKKDLTDGKNKKTILHSFFNKNKEEKSKKEDISYIQKYLTNVDDSFFARRACCFQPIGYQSAEMSFFAFFAFLSATGG